jgi:hypothetical protein
MANDWIKMRGAIFNSPKLIAVSHALRDDSQFNQWLHPGNGHGDIVSDHGYRSVTGALLCVTWSWSREFGKELPNGDCLLPHIHITEIDGIAGAPGVGDAMALVGWAVQCDEGVILPEFFLTHNVPLSAGEKQKAYRERKKTVTKPLPTRSNESVKNVTLREEKSLNKETQILENLPITDLQIQTLLCNRYNGNEQELKTDIEHAKVNLRKNGKFLTGDSCLAFMESWKINKPKFAPKPAPTAAKHQAQQDDATKRQKAQQVIGERNAKRLTEILGSAVK